MAEIAQKEVNNEANRIRRRSQAIKCAEWLKMIRSTETRLLTRFTRFNNRIRQNQKNIDFSANARVHETRRIEKTAAKVIAFNPSAHLSTTSHRSSRRRGIQFEVNFIVACAQQNLTTSRLFSTICSQMSIEKVWKIAENEKKTRQNPYVDGRVHIERIKSVMSLQSNGTRFMLNRKTAKKEISLNCCQSFLRWLK